MAWKYVYVFVERRGSSGKEDEEMRGRGEAVMVV